MICKDNQKLIDTLLRFKNPNTTKTNTKMVNRIGSYEDSNITKLQCSKSISELMDQGNSNNNKVASTTAVKKIGELAEFQSLLRAYIH